MPLYVYTGLYICNERGVLNDTFCEKSKCSLWVKLTKIEISADLGPEKTGVSTPGYFINFAQDTHTPKGTLTSYVPRT